MLHGTRTSGQLQRQLRKKVKQFDKKEELLREKGKRLAKREEDIISKKKEIDELEVTVNAPLIKFVLSKSAREASLRNSQ